MLTTALCLWAKTEIMSLLLKPIQKCSFYQFICTRHFAEAVIRAVWCSFKRSTLISKCQVYSWHFVFIHEIVFQLYSQYFSTFFLKWIVGKTKPNQTPSVLFFTPGRVNFSLVRPAAIWQKIQRIRQIPADWRAASLSRLWDSTLHEIDVAGIMNSNIILFFKPLFKKWQIFASNLVFLIIFIPNVVLVGLLWSFV